MPASKILVVYGSQGGSAMEAAKRIAKALGGDRCSVKDVAAVSVLDLEAADALVLGSSTWGYGDLQDDWDAALPRLSTAELRGKPVAFFGVGDQLGYPDTFADALGILHETFSGKGIDHRGGGWSTVGYDFVQSRAVDGGAFVGLALDMDNQHAETEERIARWVASLGEF